jgi:Tol biopolymer transport system component
MANRPLPEKSLKGDKWMRKKVKNAIWFSAAGTAVFCIGLFVFSAQLGSFFSKTNGMKNAIVSETFIVELKEYGSPTWFLRGLIVSPDRKRIAFVDRLGGKPCISLDGKQGRAYRTITPTLLEFSPDSKRFAYRVRENNQWFFVVDGVEQKRYDKIVTNVSIFSPDSQRVAYGAKRGDKWFAVVDGVEGKSYANAVIPYFSPDSKRVAYKVQVGEKALLVVDGVEGKRYDFVSNAFFSPDGKRIAHIIKKGKQCAVILDGIEGKHYDSILRTTVFSPDSKRLAYVAQKGRKYFAVIDGIEMRPYDLASTKSYIRSSLGDGPVFSPDSSRIAYVMEQNGKEFMVVDGIEGERYNDIQNLPVFSPDSQHIAYSADGTVVVDGRALKKHGGRIAYFPSKNLTLPLGLRWDIFSHDSKRVAFAAVQEGKVLFLLDGKIIGRHDELKGAIVFSPDSKRTVYIAKDGDKEFVVVPGVGRLEYDMAGIAGSGIFFEANDRFHFMAIKNKGVYLVDVKLR